MSPTKEIGLMPKILRWFKEGESIPDNAVFIKSERVVVGNKRVEVENLPYGGHSSWHSVTQPVYGERYLYEVKESE